MITSKQIILLSEKYVGLVKSTLLGVATVFENPTSSDLVELKKTIKSSQVDNVRYLADAKYQKVYVWDASLALHTDVRKLLNLPYEPEKSTNTIYGETSLSGSKLQFILVDPIGTYITQLELRNVDNQKIKKIKIYLSGVFGYNWNWLDNYILGISSYLNSQHEKFNTLVKIK